MQSNSDNQLFKRVLKEFKIDQIDEKYRLISTILSNPSHELKDELEFRYILSTIQSIAEHFQNKGYMIYDGFDPQDLNLKKSGDVAYVENETHYRVKFRLPFEEFENEGFPFFPTFQIELKNNGVGFNVNFTIDFGYLKEYITYFREFEYNDPVELGIPSEVISIVNERYTIARSYINSLIDLEQFSELILTLYCKNYIVADLDQLEELIKIIDLTVVDLNTNLRSGLNLETYQTWVENLKSIKEYDKIL